MLGYRPDANFSALEREHLRRALIRSVASSSPPTLSLQFMNSSLFCRFFIRKQIMRYLTHKVQHEMRYLANSAFEGSAMYW
jgi:hypothetical protein